MTIDSRSLNLTRRSENFRHQLETIELIVVACWGVSQCVTSVCARTMPVMPSPLFPPFIC